MKKQGSTVRKVLETTLKLRCTTMAQPASPKPCMGFVVASGCTNLCRRNLQESGGEGGINIHRLCFAINKGKVLL